MARRSFVFLLRGLLRLFRLCAWQPFAVARLLPIRPRSATRCPEAGRRRTGVPHQTSDLRWKYRFSVSSSGRRSQQSRHRSKPVRRLECVASHGQQRGAGSLGAGPSGVTGPWQAHHPRSPLAVLPNPSLKRSANGRPPGPGWWYAVHFHQPGPGVLPSSPA